MATGLALVTEEADPNLVSGRDDVVFVRISASALMGSLELRARRA